MKYPTWLGSLGKKEEQLRASQGLQARSDGWYKTVQCKRRYIAKPMTLAEVLEILPARLDEILGETVERPSTLAINSTTIDGLAEMYLAHLWQRHKTGSPRKMTRRTYDDYLRVLEKFCTVVGPKQPAIAVKPSWFTAFMRTLAGKAETTKQREIIYITAFFNWAGPGRHAQNFYKTEVPFGPDFRKPDQGKLRLARQDYSTLYSAADVHAAFDAVAPSPMLYAMGLLALNCAFLPVDLATIPLNAIKFDTGIVEFPRGKNGIGRKAVLMSETLDALQRYLSERPVDGDDALFVRADGARFCRRVTTDAGSLSNHGNALSQYWTMITGRPLKGLRTTFRTNAAGAIDKSAIDLVMGHGAKNVGDDFYVKQFEPERLKKVIEIVWQRVGPRECLPAVAEIGPSALAKRMFRVRPKAARRGAASKPQPQTEKSGTAAA